MVNFAPDVWDKIASYGLSHADIQSMSDVDNALKSALKPRRESNQCADKASEFNSLTEMSNLLQEISTLRRDLKSKPLSQVMLRLYALPLSDRTAGLASLRAALADRALAIEYRQSEVPEPDRLLSYDSARSAVHNGERVDITASSFNLTLPEAIEILDFEAAHSNFPGSAGFAMERGGHVHTVAQQFAINSTLGRHLLEIRSVHSDSPRSAGHAVRRGGHVQTVAKQFGITSPEGIRELEITAVRSIFAPGAGLAMRTGGNVQTVARQFGITSPEGIRELEITAARSYIASFTVSRYGNVQTAALLIGITSPEAIRELEINAASSSFAGSAGHAMWDGGNVQTVAQQFGITFPEGIRELEKSTTFPGAPFFHLRRPGRLDPYEAMEERGVRGQYPESAFSAMKAGAKSQTVAQKFGITSPEGIEDLKSLSIWRRDNPQAARWNVGKKLAYLFGQGHRMKPSTT